MAAESIWTRQGTYIGGKRFLSGEVPYLFEKDKRELERLNAQHYLLKSACGGKNYFVPVTHPKRILDVASGTGIWGREVAQHFRQATVWNLDKDEAVHAMARRVLTLPINFRFKRWEYPAPLPFEPGYFDYTHMRFVGVVVKAADWPVLIADMLRVTRPGGWIGLMEGGLYQTPSETANLLQEQVKQVLQRYGQEPESGPSLEGWARAAGLSTIQAKPIVVGNASKAQQETLVEQMCASATNAAETLIRAGAFNRSEMQDILHDLPLELRALGVSITFYAVYGQKPL